jgi:uncharacterized protein with HEPN domain
VSDDHVYLAHIRDAIQRIEAFTSGGRVKSSPIRQVQAPLHTSQPASQ